MFVFSQKFANVLRCFFYFRAGFLTWHNNNIPEDEVFVKVGGDHGRGNMKFAFQLANLENPNSSKKTVVFTLFKAKDTRNNLRTAMERYKLQLESLRQSKWQ